jgi:hypothetical protein
VGLRAGELKVVQRSGGIGPEALDARQDLFLIGRQVRKRRQQLARFDPQCARDRPEGLERWALATCFDVGD